MGPMDKQKVFDALATPPSGPSIQPIIALRKDAKIQQHGNGKAPPLARDEILRAIRRKGRKGWKQESGYHRRSLAETLIYRYKHLIGGKLKARSEANQQVESRPRLCDPQSNDPFGQTPIGADRKKQLTNEQQAKTIPTI